MFKRKIPFVSRKRIQNNFVFIYLMESLSGNEAATLTFVTYLVQIRNINITTIEIKKMKKFFNVFALLMFSQHKN